METEGSARRLRTSVALCTHNGERFVAEQVRSILGQSEAPIEIVVSDDASTDATVEVIRATVSEHAGGPVELRVLENAVPLGVTKNFEQAMLACTGDLIALSDQDDRWAPNRLEAAVTRFAENPDLSLLHGDARLVDERGGATGPTLFGALGVSAWERERIRSGHAMDVFLRRNLVTGATTVVRKSLLENAALFPQGWVHDEWLGVIAAATGRVDFVDDSLVDYRQHGGNQIGATKLNLAGKFGRLREPRTRRNERLAANAATLVERLERLGNRVPADILHAAKGKLEHERVRLALPAGRIARIRPVLREASSGGYRRFGLGLQDVLRDLVQPAD